MAKLNIPNWSELEKKHRKKLNKDFSSKSKKIIQKIKERMEDTDIGLTVSDIEIDFEKGSVDFYIEKKGAKIPGPGICITLQKGRMRSYCDGFPLRGINEMEDLVSFVKSFKKKFLKKAA